MRTHPLMKKAEPTTGDEFARAVNEMAARQMKADAFRDVGSMAVAALGAGAAGRGLAGLYNLVNRPRRKKTLEESGVLAVPYPVAKQAGDGFLRRVFGGLLKSPGAVGRAATKPHWNRLNDSARRVSLETEKAVEADLARRMAAQHGKDWTANASLHTNDLHHAPIAAADKAYSTEFAAGRAPIDAMQKMESLRQLGRQMAAGGVAATGTSLLAGLAGRLAKKPEPAVVTPEKAAGFLAGDFAGSKSGVPWYGPAMVTAGLAGLAGGWAGVDTMLDARRKAENQAAVEAARKDFHDALLAQYDRPLAGAPKEKKKEESTPLRKAGEALNLVWSGVADALSGHTKAAFDWSDAAGQAAGGYGAYAGLSALLGGAVVYNQMKKRSRQAVLDKAIQKRDRRRFAQQPTEIYAVPEPVEVPGA